MEQLSSQSSKPSVLIVEDDRALRDTYSELLRLSGFSVSCAGSGPEAIRLLPSLKPAIVILDMNLPGGYSGTVVLAFIRSHLALRNTYVIVISGQGGSESRAQLMKADCFLRKPVSVSDLISSVTSVQAGAS
jgi:CheY-like chemotaxis protein